MTKGTNVSNKVKKPQTVDSKAIIEDMELQLEAAKKAQLEKMEKSRDHLVAQLEMASKKYLTVNGFMQARSTIDQASFGDESGFGDFNDQARDQAKAMSKLAGDLAASVAKMPIDAIDEAVLDGYLDETFVDFPQSLTSITWQMLVVSLLQNVGPVIDDMVTFREATQHEIDKLIEEIKQQKADATIREENKGLKLVEVTE